MQNKKDTIYIGADHAGFKAKEEIKKYLENLGYNVLDQGALKFDKNDDYPDFAEKVAKKIVEKNGRGILICGSGHGICIAANKIRGTRAVYVSNIRDAKLAREHNDANILCFSGWKFSIARVKAILNIWLDTEFSGEKRHKRRIEKIKKIEGK